MEKQEFQIVCKQIACDLRRKGETENAAAWENAGNPAPRKPNGDK